MYIFKNFENSTAVKHPLLGVFQITTKFLIYKGMKLKRISKSRFLLTEIHPKKV